MSIQELSDTSGADMILPQEENTGVTPRLTLRKGEKLRHRQLVDSLFSKGHKAYEFPLRLNWRAVTKEETESLFSDGLPSGIAPIQMMITVPKKKRRHAVDRVLMRRRIREAYRLNRNFLFPLIKEHPELRTLSMSFIYIHNENLPFATIERKMKFLLEKVAKALMA